MKPPSKIYQDTPVQGLPRFYMFQDSLKDGKCPSCKEIPTTPINGAVCNLVLKDEDSKEDKIVIFTNQVKELIGGDIPCDEDTLETVFLSLLKKDLSEISQENSCNSFSIIR